MLPNRLLPAVTMLAALFTGAIPAMAEDAATADAPAAGPTESQQFARQRLLEMAGYLGGLEKFSVDMHANYDVLQDNGQMIEFGEVRKISVKRPDQARIEQVASDGNRDLVVFDGKDMSVYSTDSAVFAQVAQPADLDTAVMYLLEGLKLRLPLAPLLLTNFRQILESRVVEAEFVETTDMFGQSADHIAARTDAMEFQVWIADGEQPWPLRIVMTYNQLEGWPQFRANLSNWDASPKFDQTQFVFKPARDAKRIPFAAHFTTAPTSGAEASGGTQ